MSPLKLCTSDNRKREFGTEAKTTRRNTKAAKVLSIAKEDALGLPCHSYSFDEKFQLSETEEIRAASPEQLANNRFFMNDNDRLIKQKKSPLGKTKLTDNNAPQTSLLGGIFPIANA